MAGFRDRPQGRQPLNKKYINIRDFFVPQVPGCFKDPLLLGHTSFVRRLEQGTHFEILNVKTVKKNE
jgi:hypothetical protein